MQASRRVRFGRMREESVMFHTLRGRTAVGLIAGLSLVIAACASDAPPVDEAIGGDDEAAEEEESDEAEEEQGNADPDADEGGILRVATGEDFDSIDPHRGQGLTHTTWLPLVYETLVWLDGAGTPVPGIAASWEISDDGRVYEFSLREDVTWHNGRPLTADDIVFNLERIADPDTGAALAGPFGNIAEAEVLDSSTLRLTLAEPNSALLANLAFQGRAGLIAPEGVGEDNDIVEHIGTGPFVFQDYRVGDRYVVEAYPDYWGEVPAIDGVEVRIVPDASTRLAGVREGELDFAWAPPVAQGLTAEEAGEVIMQQIPENRANYLSINTQRAPFDDPQLREAMHLAISRSDIVEGGHDGFADPTIQPFFRESFWYVDDLEVRVDADLDRARALIEEGGYEGQEVTILQWDALGSDTETQVVASAWEEIGLDVSIELADIGTLVGAALEGETDVISVWIGVTLDPIRPYEYFDSTSPRHPLSGSLLRDDITDLFKRSIELSDPDERKELYRQILVENYEMYGMFYTVSPYNYVALNPRVSGFEMGMYVHYDGAGITGLQLD